MREQLDAEQDEDVVKCCMCGRDDDGEYLLCDGLDADGNPMARDDSEWRDACNNYRDDASKAKLAAMGLS